MNGRINAGKNQMDEWLNDWMMIDWLNDWMNICKHECMNVWMHELIKWIDD